MNPDTVRPSASTHREHDPKRAGSSTRPTFAVLGDCENGGKVSMGRPVKVGSFTFQVRRVDEAGVSYEVWRCGADLGSFVLDGDGTIQVIPRSAFSVDEVLLSLVAEAYRASTPR